MFTRTCRLSWRHLDCRDVIKICGQLWSQMQPYMKFWASFSKIYRFQQAKPIRKLTIHIGLACLNRKISENLAHKFHVKFFLSFCCKSCPHLGRWLNANLNGQIVIAIWRIYATEHNNFSSLLLETYPIQVFEFACPILVWNRYKPVQTRVTPPP